MSQLIDRYSEGVFIISATPFTENGELDLSSTDSMVDFYLDSGVSETDAVATGTAKTLRGSGGFFEGQQIGIAFNINENMSVSYTESTETYNAQSSAANQDVDQKADAIQFAYSMGGMSIKAYQMDVTNPAFDEDAGDASVTEIALGLAF